MSYLALARKYRPQDFESVSAQNFVTTTLQNAIKMGRVGHAYLFTGPRGVGKTSTARIFAKALNCLHPNGTSPCGVCENCVDIAAGTSMDVIEIDGASNRGVDEIRSLRENVKFVPVKSKYKIYIVDEVHMLTKEAFNALLKTLEEPPEFAIFIFATTDAQKVPATILSRCQRYEFKKIPYEDMFKNLAEILQAERIEYEDDALNFIIRNSEGCMRDALSILDQVVAYADGKVDAKSAAFLTGVSDKYLIDDIFAAILKEEADQIPDITEQIDAKGMDFSYAAECLAEHTRNLLFVIITGNVPSKEFIKYEVDFYISLKKYASQERLYALFQIFQKLSQDMKYCDFPRYVFEFAAFKGASISKIVPLPKTYIDQENQVTSKIETSVTKQIVPQRQSIISNEKAGIKADIKNEIQKVEKKVEKDVNPIINNMNLSSQEIWIKTVKIIDEKGGPLSSNLSFSHLFSADPEKIVIAFPSDREFQYNYLKKSDKHDFIQNIMKDIAAHAPRLEFILQKSEEMDKKKVSVDKIESFKERQIKKSIKTEPIIAALLDEMDGEIESVTFFKKKDDEYKEND